MEVIGAGFGRTGTASLKLALEMLGYDPCYHMIEVFKNPQDTEKWMDVVKADNGKEYDFELIFSPADGRRYKAAVDHPACGYYRELLKQYPNAKVIVSVRDSPDVWYESAAETIYTTTMDSNGRFTFRLLGFFIPKFRKFSRMVDAVVWNNPNVFNGQFAEKGKQIYIDWINEVKRTIPKKQLLIFNVKQGWEPLCKFLNKPVPDKPFPRVNDRKEFQDRINKMAYGVAGGLVLVAGALAAGLIIALKFRKQ